jgi:dienelactone hydrolase
MIRLPEESIDQRAARLATGFEIVLPSGPGPFPVVVMLHGCGRPDGPQPVYAEAARKAGIASVIVDSYQSRQIGLVEAGTLVCTGMRLWGRERAGDLLAALHWVRAQPWADAVRLGALGWSHGGWTVMDALALTGQIPLHAGLSPAPPAPLEGLRCAMAVYPWCGTGSHTTACGWQTSVPFATVIGGRDIVARPEAIEKAVARLERDGLRPDVLRLPEATHSFDEPFSINPTVVLDPGLRDRSAAFFVDHARRHLLA